MTIPRHPPADDPRLDAALDALDLPRRVRLLTGADLWRLHGDPDVGLRAVVTSDGPAGVRGGAWDERDVAACLPSPSVLGASFDPALVGRLAALLAGEARRKGVDVLLAPTINLQRTPYGGRHFECFSEDPHLTADLAAAFVEGLQRAGVAATPKHLVANDTETERMTVDVRVDDRTLREVDLVPFEAALVEGGAWLTMAAYNAVDGTTMTEHPLLRHVVEEAWGFDGVTVSDWLATRSTVAAARAGLHLAMPGPWSPWTDGALEQAVEAGQVDPALVADKVRRILRLAARVGALRGVPAAAPPQPGPPPDDPAVRAVLREAAARGTVLLRNDGLLPLDPGALGSIAVVGPNAAVARIQGGGSANLSPPHAVSPLAGLRAALPDAQILHAVGDVPRETLEPLGATTATDPVDGSPGVRVRFLDAAGEVVGEEHRDTGHLTWTAGFGTTDDGRVVTVEVTARIRGVLAGPHRVGVAGVGAFEVLLDGARTAADLAPPEGDPILLLTRPRELSLTAALAPDRELDLVVRHRTVGPGAVLRVGVAPEVDPETLLADAGRLAAAADVAVVVIGTTEEVESEGRDRDRLALPGRQDELVRRVAAANPRTVVVLNAGAPVLTPWAEDVASLLLVGFPGQEAGHALADVLLGIREPGGRLAQTWPAEEDALAVRPATPVDGRLERPEGVEVGYRGWLRTGEAPAYWFGEGHGYTTWEYGPLQVDPPDGDGLGGVVRVEVRNGGDRAGREVVQVYLSRPDDAAAPLRWFAAAGTLEAGPGERVLVEVPLPRRALRRWRDGGWELPPGDLEVHAGRSVVDLLAHGRVTVPPTTR